VNRSPNPRSATRDTPRLVIVMTLEDAPHICTDTVGDWEASRLCDWISRHADLAELLDMAIESLEWLRREEVA
jgi:hypothetical protein